MVDTPSPQPGIVTPTRHKPATNLGVIVLAIVVILALGVLIGGLLLPEPTPPSVATPPEAGTIATSTETYDGSRMVAVNPQIAEAQLLHSPTAGIITADDCSAGGAITSGTSPWSVNGQPLLALATDVPLWRDLAAKTTGADVSALQTELARLGYDVATTGTYDSATQQAMKALWKAIGGNSKEESLPLASVIWLPAPSAPIASCSAQKGDQVTPGQELAQVAGRLQSLILTTPPGEGWNAVYGDNTATIDADGRITDPVFLAAMEAGPEFGIYTTMGSGTFQVQVKLTEARQVIVVPPSAVVVAAAGHGCVSTDGRTIPVDIVSSSLGQTMVATTDGSSPATVDLHPDPSMRCP